jgi:hypothetical protein
MCLIKGPRKKGPKCLLVVGGQRKIKAIWIRAFVPIIAVLCAMTIERRIMLP